MASCNLCSKKVQSHCYQLKCDVCNIEYDFILKVETLEEDSMFLLKELQLNDKITNVPHLNHNANEAEMDRLCGYARNYNDRALCEFRVFFSTLSWAQKRKLFNYYRVDFEAFGYDTRRFI